MTAEYLFPTSGGSGSSSGGGTSTGVLEAALAAQGNGSAIGLDVLCFPDLDGQLRLVGGFPLLAQDLLNRLQTPRGALFYDESYGYDIPGLLNSDLDERDVPRIAAEIVAQCLLDDRVFEVSADVVLYRLENRLRITLQGECAEGPFWFVLGVSEMTVDLLEIR